MAEYATHHRGLRAQLSLHACLFFACRILSARHVLPSVESTFAIPLSREVRGRAWPALNVMYDMTWRSCSLLALLPETLQGEIHSQSSPAN